MNNEKSYPIIQKEGEYSQKTNYIQLDRQHEEVLDLDSPLADIQSNDTKIYTFILTGDQNAGKSTFLHAFTNWTSNGFLELTSFIPLLSSTFINSRFRAPDSGRPPMDQPPFLDTDIARTTFLLTFRS